VTNNVVQMKQEAPALHSIRDIIADLSRPVNPQRLKQRRASNKSNEMLSYLPWYQAVRYLDYHAPGWTYEVRSVTQIGDAVAVTVRITIPAAEGLIFREATG